MNAYRVWHSGEKPEHGAVINARNSFEARKEYARAYTAMGVLDVMARRLDFENDSNLDQWEKVIKAFG